LWIGIVGRGSMAYGWNDAVALEERTVLCSPGSREVAESVVDRAKACARAAAR
jgi:hypothetical protein